MVQGTFPSYVCVVKGTFPSSVYVVKGSIQCITVFVHCIFSALPLPAPSHVPHFGSLHLHSVFTHLSLLSSTMPRVEVFIGEPCMLTGDCWELRVVPPVAVPQRLEWVLEKLMPARKSAHCVL